jgi:ABC-type dipeptide/oligopeptide/nickel transport system ATPase component
MPFRPAIRTKAKPIIALYGESGSGKTYSALLMARGFVGPSGKIAMIDTESGRGELYADDIEGGYDVLPLDAPFEADRYIDAIKEAEKAGYGVVVIDSASHEWNGIGGVLTQAEAIEERTGTTGLHCWKKPKAQHGLFVLKLLGSRIAIILCLRAKYKTRQVYRNGKKAIVKDDYLSPVQAEDFAYETTVQVEITREHKIGATKTNALGLGAVFPAGEVIGVKTGQALAAWAGHGAEVVHEDAPEIDSADLLARAQLASEGGADDLQAFWKGCSKPERAIVSTVIDDLKATAMAADDARAEAYQKDAAE